MKKIFITLCAAALVACTVSCKKEKEDPVPVYEEGIYHPCQKIATVSNNGALAEEWAWSGDNLSSITANGTGMTQFNYSGDYITKVTSARDFGEEIRYSYNGKQISGCEIYYEDALAVTMTMQHNAEGKVSGADIVVDDNFLLNLATNLLGRGTAFEKLVGRSTIESMILMAKLDHRPSAPKFEITNKTFSMGLQWTGENLSQQIISGSFIVGITTDDIEFIQRLINIPEQYLSLIQMAMTLSGGQLPLKMTLTDTISSTFDDKYNPMFCNWGEVFSARTLSLNNVLKTAHSGGLKISISMMGQENDLFNQPQTMEETYTYEYNTKNYPIKVIGDGEKTYTYKDIL